MDAGWDRARRAIELAAALRRRQDGPRDDETGTDGQARRHLACAGAELESIARHIISELGSTERQQVITHCARHGVLPSGRELARGEVRAGTGRLVLSYDAVGAARLRRNAATSAVRLCGETLVRHRGRELISLPVDGSVLILRSVPEALVMADTREIEELLTRRGLRGHITPGMLESVHRCTLELVNAGGELAESSVLARSAHAQACA